MLSLLRPKWEKLKQCVEFSHKLNVFFLFKDFLTIYLILRKSFFCKIIMTATANFLLMSWLGNYTFALLVPPPPHLPTSPQNFTILGTDVLTYAFLINLPVYNEISKWFCNYYGSLNRQEFCKQGDVDNIAIVWNIFSEKSENAACWGISHQTQFWTTPSHEYKSQTNAIKVLALLWKMAFQYLKHVLNRTEGKLFPYLIQRPLSKERFCLSLFSKLLERRNLDTGIHFYSVILEPKRASIPQVALCQPITKHSSKKLRTARLPAASAFAEVTLFWHYPGGPGFLLLGSQSLSLPPLCDNLLLETFIGYLQYNERNRRVTKKIQIWQLLQYRLVWLLIHVQTNTLLSPRVKLSIISSRLSQWAQASFARPRAESPGSSENNLVVYASAPSSPQSHPTP